MIIASMTALKETDIKKIVALSTLRQLGIIIFRIGIILDKARFFHLIIHAYFKALLFIRVGNIIHLSDDYQDLRKINFFESNSSITLTIALFANIRLIGFPFIRGFYSKELIIELLYSFNHINNIIFIFFRYACVLTSTYTFKFIFQVIMNPRKRKPIILKFKEDKMFSVGRSTLIVIGTFLGRTLI